MNLSFSLDANPGMAMDKVHGVMVGVVTNNKDPEQLARIKVKLPIHEGEYETDWIRISTLMAGNDRGSLFIPEVNDEVLVAFHMGELRAPIVIGTLWNSKSKAPKGNDKNDIRKFRSRSGHELEFNDAQGDEKVIIKTKKGQTIELSDKQSVTTIKDDSGKNEIVVSGGSANEITIKSNTTVIKLDAKGQVTIESNQAVKISSTQINMEAKAAFTIKGGASVDIKSDGMINIKGSMVKIN